MAIKVPFDDTGTGRRASIAYPRTGKGPSLEPERGHPMPSRTGKGASPEPERGHPGWWSQARRLAWPGASESRERAWGYPGDRMGGIQSGARRGDRLHPTTVGPAARRHRRARRRTSPWRLARATDAVHRGARATFALHVAPAPDRPKAAFSAKRPLQEDPPPCCHRRPQAAAISLRSSSMAIHPIMNDTSRASTRSPV